MKKSIFILSLSVFSFISCQVGIEEDTQTDVVSKNKSEITNKRSYEEALYVAQQSISMLNGNADNTRSATLSRNLDLDNGVFAVCTDKVATRSSDVSENDTLMYVFNFNDNKGFALVSANMQTEALVAITEQGFYDPSTECVNKDFPYIIELAKQYVLRGDDNILAKSTTATRANEDLWLLCPSIDNLITVTWGQTDPEGLYCPYSNCGCSITSMATLMSYYSYPSSINIDYDLTYIPNYTLDWTDMKKHIKKHLPAYMCNASNNAHNMISHLCRQLGEVANSYYDIIGTFTNEQDWMGCLEYYGYNVPSFTAFSEQSVVSQLNLERPVILIGNLSSTISHLWIMDGYKCYVLAGSIGPNLDPVYKYYNHMNWSYDGDCNGYFLEGIFNTQSADSYDSTHNNSFSLYNIRYTTPTVSE